MPAHAFVALGMPLSFHRPPLPGWVACAPQDGQAWLACVERPAEGLPRVHWAERCDWSDAARTLRTLRRRRALHRHRSVALLDGARCPYRVLAVDAPDLPRAEWSAALRWQLKDLVDFAVDDASIDVLEVPGDPARRRAAQALAIAAPHAPLRPLVEAADAAGAPWQALDVPETALRNLSALVEPPGRAQALLHVGAAGSRLVVTAGGELLLSRTLEARLAQLSDAAAETGDEADAATRLQAFDAVGLELQRTLDGFDRLFSHLSLARLLVAPGAGLADFCAHLGELTFVPVQPLDLSAALDLSAVPELADPAVLGPFLAPIGAALREGVP